MIERERERERELDRNDPSETTTCAYPIYPVVKTSAGGCSGCRTFGVKFLGSIFPSAVTTWKESAFATHALVAIAIVQVV